MNKNMKKKALVSSILTIALCFSVIAGATFALFTSESEVNIAVTSGKVNLEAYIDEASLATSSLGVAQTAGTFAVGGTASFDKDADLTLDKIVPGDKATFEINVKNNSNVDIMYKITWTVDNTALDVLEVTSNGAALADLGWTEWKVADAGTNKVLPVEIELPMDVSDEKYQGQTANVTFAVEAIQANAVTETVATGEQLAAALEAGVEEITLQENVTLAGTATVPEGAKTTIDLNGKSIVASHHKADGAVIENNGTLVITGGTIKSAGNNGGSAIMNNGTLTVNDATLNGAKNEGNEWPAYTVNNTGVMTLTNTTITSTHGAVASYSENAVVTLNNCTIDMSGIPGFTSHGMYTYNGGSIVVNGGTYENKATDQNATGGSVINGKVTVNSGTFSGRIENYYGTPNLCGGTFNTKPSASFINADFEAVDNGDGTYSVNPKPGVTIVDTPAKLETELENAAAAGSGDSKVIIRGDIDLTGTTWEPISVDGYNGAGIVTVEGNGNTISGLTAPLFAGGFAGNSGIVIKNLTIDNSTIVGSSQGGGAFVDSADSMQVVTLENCHVKNSTITGGRVGGLLGWCSGYANLNDGPVKTYVTIKNCSVDKCEIIGAGSAGGVAGHPGASDYTYTTIENCSVTNTTIHSNDDGGWRVGTIVGTANNGHVEIKGCTVENVTLTQVGKTAPVGQSDVYGRFVPSGTGTLVIDGVNYFVDATSLRTFAEAATGEVTVVLGADVTLGDATTQKSMGAYFPNATKVTVLGNGNTLTLKGQMPGNDWAVQYYAGIIAPNAVVTVKDMTIVNEKLSKAGTQTSADRESVYSLAYGTEVVFEDVEFIGGVMAKNNTKFVKCTFIESVLTKNDAGFATDGKFCLFIDHQYTTNGSYEFTLEGCTFDASGYGCVKIAGDKGANITVNVKDCTFTNTCPRNNWTQGTPKWDVKMTGDNVTVNDLGGNDWSDNGNAGYGKG